MFVSIGRTTTPPAVQVAESRRAIARDHLPIGLLSRCNAGIIRLRREMRSSLTDDDWLRNRPAAAPSSLPSSRGSRSIPTIWRSTSAPCA